MEKLKEDIIRKFIKAYNMFDVNSMVSLLHPDIRFRNISNNEITTQTSGKEQFETLARQSAALFKEREQKIISLEETGDGIIVTIQYEAILAVDFPNELKAGEKISLKGKSEYIFKDGLIYSIVDES